jgi:ATP-binding cassette, subfamily B, bacterial PglK
MNSFIHSLWVGFSKKRKIQLVKIAAVFLVGSIVEVLSIASIIPLTSVFINPDKIFEYSALIYVFDIVNIKQEYYLLCLTVLFITISLISGCIKLWANWISIKFIHMFGAEVSLNIFESSLYQNYSTHAFGNSSRIVDAATRKVMIFVGHIILSGIRLLNAIILLVLIVALILIATPGIAIYMLVFIVVPYFLLIKLFRPVLEQNSKIIADSQGQAMQVMHEGLAGIREVIISNSYDFFVKDYSSKDRKFRFLTAKNDFIAQSPRFIIETIVLIVAAFFLYILNQEGRLVDSMPSIALLVIAMQKLFPVTQTIYSSISSISSGRSSAEEVMGLSRCGRMIEESQCQTDVLFKSQIEFKKVYFRYKNKVILSDVNLTIEKGDVVGVVGVSGSGKSTFIDLLMGLIPPESGRIVVDSLNLQQSNVKSWHKIISHVPQNIYLLDATISENIAFGLEKDQIDMDKVRFASSKAHLTKYVNTLEKGFNEFVGENGGRVSGGQKQRIGIARALYNKKVDLLILDEATSALDAKTGRKIIKSINDIDSRMTVIMVTHNHDTLGYCNKVYEIDNGKVYLKTKE